MIMLKTFERSPNFAEMKVSYRRGKGRDTKQLAMPFVVSNPISCEEYLRTIWDKDTLELREEFIVLCLNTANEALGWVKLATGGIDVALIDPRLVFGVALQAAAPAIIIAHNHPGGSLFPSPEDRALTRRLREGAEILRIRLVDHVILTARGAFSFAQEGLL